MRRPQQDGYGEGLACAGKGTRLKRAVVRFIKSKRFARDSVKRTATNFKRKDVLSRGNVSSRAHVRTTWQ